MIRNGRGGDRSRRDPNAMLFLSILLLLLAFFIVMASVSRHEQRRGGLAMASVSAAFHRPVAGRPGAAEVPLPPGPVLSAETTMARVRQVFEAALPVLRVEVFRRGTGLRVTVPLSALYLGDSPRLRVGRDRLFDAMADALGQAPSGARYQVRAIFGGPLPALPAEGGLLAPGLFTRLAAVDPGALALLRAGDLARDLRSRGIAADALAVGLGGGSARSVVFEFTPWQPPAGDDGR